MLVAALMLAAACGGGTPTETTAAPSGPAAGDSEEVAATEASEVATETVTVGLTSLHSWYWPLLAARDEGLMEPFGIELDVVTFQNLAQLASGLVADSVDIALVAPETMFGVQQSEPDVRVIASMLSANPQTLIVHPDIASVEDLRGQIIGVSTVGASADFFTGRLMLLRNGLELDTDYTMVNTGPTAERAAAMSSGQIQASLNWEPALMQLLDEGMVEIDRAANYEDLRDVEVIALNAKEGWYRDNRDVAVRFLQGFLAGMDWLYDESNRDRAIEMLADEMSVETEHAAAAYEWFIVELEAYPRDGRVDPRKLEQTVRNAGEAGVEFVPALDDLDWRYDNSLVEEAASR